MTIAHRLGLAAVAASVALSLVGCPRQAAQKDETDPAGGPTTRREAPHVASAPERREGVTLHYYTYALGPAAELDRALARRFEEDTGIHVELMAKPQTTDEIYAAYQAQFAAHKADWDVLMLDVIWPGTMAPHLKDLTADLSDAAQGAFAEIVRNDTIDGKLVAMPYYVDAGLLYYRKDLLKKYGFSSPPATWQALERMAAAVQAGERRTLKDFDGFVWQGKAYEGLTCDALEWQVSAGGGEIFDAATGEPNVTNARAVGAFKRAAGWVGRISPRAVLGYDEEDARKRFQAGRAAFMRNWPYAVSSLDEARSPVHGQFDVAPLPRDESAEHGAATLGGWQLGVSAYSAHPDEAVALVRYLTSPEVQKWRAIEGAFPPARRATYDDGELIAARPFMRAVPAAMEGAVARPSSRTKERYAAVSRAYYTGVSAILHGADPVATTRALQATLASLLR